MERHSCSIINASADQQTRLAAMKEQLASIAARPQVLWLSTAETSAPAETGLVPAQMQLVPAEADLVPAQMQLEAKKAPQASAEAPPVSAEAPQVSAEAQLERHLQW